MIGDFDISSFDALAIPGGFEVYGFYNDAYDDKFLDLIEVLKQIIKLLHLFVLELYLWERVAF